MAIDPQHIELGKEIQNMLFRMEILERDLQEQKELLKVAQSRCRHPNMELYRNRKTGVCAICLFEGPNHTQIDLYEIGVGTRM